MKLFAWFFLALPAAFAAAVATLAFRVFQQFHAAAPGDLRPLNRDLGWLTDFGVVALLVITVATFMRVQLGLHRVRSNPYSYEKPSPAQRTLQVVAVALIAAGVIVSLAILMREKHLIRVRGGIEGYVMIGFQDPAANARSYLVIAATAAAITLGWILLALALRRRQIEGPGPAFATAGPGHLPGMPGRPGMPPAGPPEPGDEPEEPEPGHSSGEKRPPPEPGKPARLPPPRNPGPSS